MDFNTHKKYAKLDDGVDDRQNMGVVVSDTPASIVKEEKEMDEAEKLAKVISDALLNKQDCYGFHLYPLEVKKHRMKHLIK